MARRDDDRRRQAPRREEPEYDEPRRPRGYQRQSIGEAAAKSLIRSIASSIGRILVRSITGRMR
jgi:hypothetical protein